MKMYENNDMYSVQKSQHTSI